MRGVRWWCEWRVAIASVALALCLTACNSDEYLLRDGAGIDLFSSRLPETTQLQDAYVAYICDQSSIPTISGPPGCDVSRFGPAQWSIFVQTGMNDIDQRCDTYLAWLDNKKRWAGPVLQQISDVRTATEAIMVATGAAGPYPIGIVGAAFGLASRTFTNVNSRLVLELNHSTVQAVVLSRQRRYRMQLLGDPVTNTPAIAIVSRPAAIHALRSYLRLCMPFTIETEINTTITDFERGGVAAMINNQPLINAETVRTAVISNVRKQLPSEGFRPPPGVDPKKVFDTRLENSLCVPLTRQDKEEAVRDFFAGRGLVRSTAKPPIRSIKDTNVPQLLQNVAASIGDCKKKGFRNAYEVGRFGATSDQSALQASESVGDLQNGLRAKLGLTAADLTSGKLDQATRKAIVDFRNKKDIDKSFGDQVDDRLVTEAAKSDPPKSDPPKAGTPKGP
jgi:hypothetical protein